MHPPRIYHMHSLASDDRKELCLLCSKALHMGKGEAALLSYYAACSDGFSPAVATVCKETGLKRSQVYNVRESLCKHGVAMLKNNSLCLDWYRIRTFASLNPSMTSKHCTIAPVNAKKLDYNIYNNCKLFAELKSCSQEQAIGILGTMTEELYDSLCGYIRNKRLEAEAA